MYQTEIAKMLEKISLRHSKLNCQYIPRILLHNPLHHRLRKICFFCAPCLQVNGRVTGHPTTRKFRHQRTHHHSAHVLRTRNTWYEQYLGLFCGGEFVAGDTPWWRSDQLPMQVQPSSSYVKISQKIYITDSKYNFQNGI